MQEKGQCGETFLAFRKFPKFSSEFDWSGKMQKSGKFRSGPLIFPLPYVYDSRWYAKYAPVIPKGFVIPWQN
jgi:hypothetical protein